MGASVSIEIDRHTANVLEVRAAELGITVPQLIAELAALDSEARNAEDAELAELDRRYHGTAESVPVPHDRVVGWLRTWGTTRFRQWPGP
jgi:hypothetical protein